MARLYSSGFELQIINAYSEFDSVTSTPTADSSIKRSGQVSMRCNTTSASRYGRLQYAAGGTTNDTFFRFYLYIATAPSTGGPYSVLILYDTTAAGNVATIRLNTTRTLELWGNSAQLGSDSSALDTATWYRIEVSVVGTTITAYINGVQFATGSATAAYDDPNRFDLGVVTAGTMDLYFDDVAINNQTGSYQTGLPGDGKIIHLNPTGAGDNTQWTPTAGSNWDCVEEHPPSETDYVYQSTLNYIDDYAVSDSGIGSTDTVNVVHVGARHLESVASSTMAYRVRIKKTASGTVAESANIIPNNTAVRTYRTTAPRVPQLTTYLDPDNVNPWTQTTLDSMQIGVRATVDSTSNLYISKLWAVVDYTPASGVTVDATVQSSTYSQPSSVVSVIANVAIAATLLTATVSDITPQITVSTGSSSIEISAESEGANFLTPAPVISVPAETTISAPIHNATYSTPNPTVTTYHTLKTDYFYIRFYPAQALISASVDSATFSQPTATVTAVIAVSVNTTASIQAATFSDISPVISTTKNISSVASIQEATYSQPTSVVSADRNISHSAGIQEATFSNPTSSLTYNDNEQIAIGISEATFSQPASTVSANTNISSTASIQSATFTIIDPEIEAIVGTVNVDVNADIQAATFSIPTASITYGDNEEIAAGLSSATFNLIDSVVSVTSNVDIAPALESAIFSIPTPTISSIDSEAISASVNSATFSNPDPVVTGSSGNFLLNGNIMIDTGDVAIQIAPLRISVWTNAGRPTPATGVIGFNTDTSSLEIYNGSDWVEVNLT